MNEFKKFISLDLKDKLKYKCLMYINNKYDNITVNITDSFIKDDIKRKGNFYAVYGIKKMNKDILDLLK